MKNNYFHKDFRLNEKSFNSVTEILDFTKSNNEVFQFLKEWFSKDEFIVVQTSGSTGKPKKIKLPKEKVRNSAKMTGDFFEQKPKTTALLCLPVKYIAGKMMLVRALILGWHLDIVNPNSNPLKDIIKPYDFAAFVPLQLENSLDKINQIKKIIVGGGKVSDPLILKLQDKTTQIFATYGMTETITHVAVQQLNNFIDLNNGFENNSLFKTLRNVFIDKDERNCLVIKAPKLSKDIITTNDVVEIFGENEFKITGRFDNIINTGGIKLQPELIEEKLSKIIRSRFFVSKIEDDKLGNKLVLIIEQKNNLPSFKKDLTTKIKNLKSLEKFEIPKEIFFLPSFKLTATNKIQRNKTKKLLNI